MRKKDAFRGLDFSSGAASEHRRYEITRPVVTEPSRFLHSRTVKSAGNVSDVMFDIVFLKSHFGRIDLHRPTEKRFQIIHGLPTFPYMDKIQNLRRVSQRVLNLPG